ncbi:hypothetical protein [Lysinibacillus sp. UBA5990]|uniref:hypothetical protein n=1 Tax=Lysinibacillus sp. UBA5990 TaxID=1946773 RepID=UPI0025BB8CC4|nr:hypothetical protein [Lysinibacillus sp. UBA5990]
MLFTSDCVLKYTKWEVGEIEAQVSTETVDLLRYVWIIPIVVGFVTFVLTTVVNQRKDKKQFRMEKMAFIRYEQVETDYPFNDRDCTILYTNDIRNVLESLSHDDEKTRMTFLVLENLTENNVLDLKVEIVSSYDDTSLKSKQSINMPIWKSDEVLYIPISIPGAATHHVTDEILNVYYTTLGFEKYVIGYRLNEQNDYDEYLKKIYFKYFKYTKIKYKQSDFYSYIKVTNEEKGKQAEKEVEKQLV